MKIQGKIIAIPVKEVFEGMQVMYNGIIFHIEKISDNDSVKLLDLNGNMEISRLKQIIVESSEKYMTNPPRPVSSLILKYSQWQSTINNGMIDSNKTIEFEVIDNTYIHEGSGKYWEDEPVKMKKYLDLPDYYAEIITQ
jgi:hypothetical protein